MSSRLPITALTLLLVACTPKVAAPTIESFEDCAAAGYPVMESHPRKCATPEGTTFIEEIQEALLIEVTFPKPGDTLAGTVNITGQARGMWYFEASFPVELLDADGNQVLILPAQADGEWMTENFVPFNLEITVPPNIGSEGTLVLKKDNPSGLPEYDAELRIPVLFE